MELTVEIVKAARELISDRAHWGKGSYAAREKVGDQMHNLVGITEPDAVCFCGLGAIRKAAHASGLPSYEVEDVFCHEVRGCVPETYNSEYNGEQFAKFANFNDAPETTHEDVLGAFDCLIAKMESAK